MKIALRLNDGIVCDFGEHCCMVRPIGNSKASLLRFYVASQRWHDLGLCSGDQRMIANNDVYQLLAAERERAVSVRIAE